MFSKIPHSLIKCPNISQKSKMFYIELSVYANFETGECWPSRQKSTKRNGISLKQIISELEFFGFLEIEKRLGKTSKYKLLTPVQIDLGLNRPESKKTYHLGLNRPITPVQIDLPPRSKKTYELDPLSEIRKRDIIENQNFEFEEKHFIEEFGEVEESFSLNEKNDHNLHLDLNFKPREILTEDELKVKRSQGFFLIPWGVK